MSKVNLVGNFENKKLIKKLYDGTHNWGATPSIKRHESHFLTLEISVFTKGCTFTELPEFSF